MVKIGKYNTLEVVKQLDFGIYLDGGEKGEILMPKRYVPAGCQIGDKVDVFIYLDSEDRLIATSEKPYATAGEFAFLKVKSVDKIGAFLDWGLMKDLLVPFSEQKMKMVVNRKYLVYIYVDEETQRIAASAKIDKYLDNVPPAYETGQEVDLIIDNETELGYNAIINMLHKGMLYHNELFEYLEPGMKMKGFIKKVREDDKIDLSLYPIGYQKVEGVLQEVLYQLKEAGGYLAVTDKTDAEAIYNTFGMSKKTFKKALGALYKQRLIVIEDQGIRLA
jgi:predicted RNA-binding protein (virulence factor B family)